METVLKSSLVGNLIFTETAQRYISAIHIVIFFDLDFFFPLEWIAKDSYTC